MGIPGKTTILLQWNKSHPCHRNSNSVISASIYVYSTMFWQNFNKGKSYSWHLKQFNAFNASFIYYSLYICVCAGALGPKGSKGDFGTPGHPGFRGTDGQKGDKGAAGDPGLGIPGHPGEKVIPLAGRNFTARHLSCVNRHKLFQSNNQYSWPKNGQECVHLNIWERRFPHQTYKHKLFGDLHRYKLPPLPQQMSASNFQCNEKTHKQTNFGISLLSLPLCSSSLTGSDRPARISRITRRERS